MAKRELIGSVWVDTACLIVGDPCVLFREAVAKELEELIANEGTQNGYLDLGKDRGFVVPTGAMTFQGQPGGLCSDGFYQVYLERDADGNPVRLSVDLRVRHEGSLEEGNLRSVR